MFNQRDGLSPNLLPYSQFASDVDPAAEIMSSGQLVHDEAPAPL